MALLGLPVGILEGGTIVQHRQVVEKYRIAGRGNELQCKALVQRNLVDQVECLLLLRRQRRLQVLGRHLDVGAQVVDAEKTVAKTEHRRLAARLLAEAMVVKTLEQRR